jgi:hypothetical protein
MIQRMGPTKNRRRLGWVSPAAHPPRMSCRTLAGGLQFRAHRGHTRHLIAMDPKLNDMSTWTGRMGLDGLRSFTDEDCNFWLEQNPSKTSKWANFAKRGHDVAWEFGDNRRYTGRMLVDGDILTPGEATKRFLAPKTKS